MKDEAKTKRRLISELQELRRQISILNGSEETFEQKRESRERLMKSHLHNSIPGCFTTLKEGRFVEVSGAFLRLFEFSRDEVIGHTWEELGSISEEQRSIFLDELRKKHHIENLAIQARTRTGKLLNVLVNTVMRTVEKEKYLMTIIIDITGLKLAEESLRESERRFRAIADYTPDWENWVGPDGKLIWLNPMVFNFTGYTAEECLNMADFPMPIVDESDRERMRRLFAEAVGGSSQSNVECRIRCKDGRQKWVSLSWQPIFDENGVNLGHRSSLHDNTAFKMTEGALRESEHFQNSIFLAAPVGIGLVVNRVIKRVNRRMCNMTGYSPEELLDKSARMLYPTDAEFEFVGTEKYNQITRDGLGSVETRWVRKDGRIIDVILSSTPLEPGKLEAGVTFTALDITDRKYAEEELMRAHDELEKRIEERTAELAQVVKNLTEQEQLLAAESQRLKDANTALKVLLRQREEDRQELKKKFIDNVRRLVLPYVEKLTLTSLTPHQAAYVDVIEANLTNITSPFLRTLSIVQMDFTPREIEVAHLIQAGKTAKEIASLLNCSLRSVEFHKNNIRRKLKLIHKKTNLRTYLLSLTNGTS